MHHPMFTYPKTLLSAAVLALGLFYASHTQADLLDGGEVQFHGFVTDTAPKWTWQVSSSAQSWPVDSAEAQLTNGMLRFDLSDKGALPYLEGYLHEVAQRGGPGLTPLITFSSGGQPLTPLAGGNSHAQHFRAAVPVYDPASGKAVGRLSFTLDQAMAVSAARQLAGVAVPSGMTLVSGQSVSAVQPATLPAGIRNQLSALLLMNQGFGQGMSAVGNGQVINQGVLADGRVTRLAAAYASALSAFELTLPATGTPSQWQTGLNVSVTVQ
ncbi:fimbrial protein [Edwardsiella hoshinae]|uniref:Fimbrial protein n=2 Tax=Edwardsiella hoshinae TaxID=93378 RepID=A0A1D8MZU0_9GAMM|nr:fimbrial protein [Edwardsiella hoshinae]AOV95547.1 fimbrial protein [Edwardsiella hoshinae]AOV97499.1 fimbrial protein [Edwardsiella hoshinae]AOV97679.1 fimbrial protein [Edwardsiella hoshinae]AOV98196.1 fimbrial protein [Edwardsiella hoshinae]STC88559.1 Fimbrial, major and minor subunit [Edwardsiella hoshinae]